MPAMSRRPGLIEEQIRQATEAWLRKQGHGGATALGREISRPSSWLGQFVRRKRGASIEDAVALVRALRLKPNPLVEAVAYEPPVPIDTVQARREAQWLRLLHRLDGDPELRDKIISVVELLARQPTPRRGGTPGPHRKR